MPRKKSEKFCRKHQSWCPELWKPKVDAQKLGNRQVDASHLKKPPKLMPKQTWPFFEQSPPPAPSAHSPLKNLKRWCQKKPKWQCHLGIVTHEKYHFRDYVTGFSNWVTLFVQNTNKQSVTRKLPIALSYYFQGFYLSWNNGVLKNIISTAQYSIISV